MSFSQEIKKVINGDEYYTPQDAVDMIVPYVLGGGYKTIWCPFDKVESNYVKTFQRLGLKVNYGHIETGQDFFEYSEPQGDIVVSNPPFSKRDMIFRRLYEWNLPFALIINWNGLFDSQKRLEVFSKNNVELLIPKGRMKFIQKDKGLLNSPNFQSIYVCNHLLGQQIVFDKTKF